MVPVNILGDGYPNKTIGYLNIIIKCDICTSRTVIINDEELIITITSASVVASIFICIVSIAFLSSFPINN